MIILKNADTARKHGINPDHIIDTFLSAAGLTTVYMLEGRQMLTESSPQEIEDAISRHHTKYTRG